MKSKAALVACVVALCACSQDQQQEDPALPASASIVEGPRLELPRDEPADTRPPELDLLARDPVAVAATDHGLVAFDPGDGAILGRADTLYQVVDVVHDRWRDQWIAAEYDDDSMSRVSVWKLGWRGRVDTRLRLERTIETGGYARVIAGRSSTVVFEHDGMQSRWMIWDAEGRAEASSQRAPMPAGVVARSDATASRLLSVSISDDGSGPQMWMHSLRVHGGQSGSALKSSLPAWSGELSAVRAADAGPGRIALAQVRAGVLQLGLIDEHGHMFREPIQLGLREVQAAEDLVVDAARAIAFVAVSSPERLVTVDLEHGAMLDQQGCSLPAGGAPWFSRLIAYDAVRGRLIVGDDEGLSAWNLSSTRTLEKVDGFGIAGARRPVALSASRSGPTP